MSDSQADATPDVVELPASPGARLKREREARGLTPQQVAEQLTLDASVVTALEANDFAALGAPVFAKGHLRRYANLMQLSVDDVLSGYERSNAQPVLPTLIPRSRTTMITVRAPRKWPWVLGGTATFLLAGAVAAYLSANGLHLPGNSESPAAASSSATGQPVGDAAGSKVISAGDSAVTPGTSAAAPAVALGDTTAPAGQLRLQLRFAADSWVEVYDGTGRAVLYDLGRSGSERVVTAVAPLSVTVGNARAVSMSINGRRVAVAAPPAGQTVARFSIGADGVLR